MAANTPELYEAHFAVPMAGAVLNALNTRLDADTLAYILEHSESRVLITDREFAGPVGEALATLKDPPTVIDIDDPLASDPGPRLGAMDYEALLAEGDLAFAWQPPGDEWQAISLELHLGHDGPAQGRGLSPPRRLPARAGQCDHLGDAPPRGLPVDAADVPLQRLVLSLDAGGGRRHQHLPPPGDRRRRLARRSPTTGSATSAARRSCSTWSSTARQRREPSGGAAAGDPARTVSVMTAAAPPPAATLERMQRLGFKVTHVYGLTEVYGPSVVCA